MKKKRDMENLSVLSKKQQRESYIWQLCEEWELQSTILYVTYTRFPDIVSIVQMEM